MSQIVPKKCGVKFSPPAIIVVYCLQSTFKAAKLRVRTMPLRNFNRNSPVENTVENFRSCQRHKKYLEQVPAWQLEKLVKMIRDKLNGRSEEELVREAKRKLVIDPNEDLNKVDEESLQAKKAVMNRTFEMNRKKPGDADFEYDVVVDFQADKVETHEWDDTSEMEEF